MSSFTPGKHGENARAMRLGACVVAGLCATAGCTVAPEPPPTPQAVVQLSARYERPTADLDQAITRKLVERDLPQLSALRTLGGLAFLRRVIAQGTTPDIEGAEEINVQGSLAIHAPCPGWDGADDADDTDNGFVELTIGVDESRVQRAFSGRVTRCRFSAMPGDERAQVSASMQLEVDLGHSLGLGEPLSSVLVRLTDLSTELSGVDLGLDLDALGGCVSMRIREDALETLVDLEPLNMGRQGTILVGLRADGSVGLRGRDSAWVCGKQRSGLCVRSD